MVVEASPDLRGARIPGMRFPAVEHDVARDHWQIRRLSPVAKALEPYCLAALVQEVPSRIRSAPSQELYDERNH